MEDTINDEEEAYTLQRPLLDAELVVVARGPAKQDEPSTEEQSYCPDTLGQFSGYIYPLRRARCQVGSQCS